MRSSELSLEEIQTYRIIQKQLSPESPFHSLQAYHPFFSTPFPGFLRRLLPLPELLYPQNLVVELIQETPVQIGQTVMG